MWKNSASAFINNFKRTNYSDRRALGAGFVGECHSVDREGGGVV